MMGWNEAVTKYVEQYQSLGRSPHTLALVRTSLRYLVDFCREQKREGPGAVP